MNAAGIYKLDNGVNKTPQFLLFSLLAIEKVEQRL
jgi:hypothetical protein